MPGYARGGIGPPLRRDFDNPIGQRADFAPFAQARRALRSARRAPEMQAIDLFRRIAQFGRRRGMPQPGHPRARRGQRLLGFQDRPRAKGIPALQGQRMVENVKDPRHGTVMAQQALTGYQPDLVQMGSPKEPVSPAHDRPARLVHSAFCARAGRVAPGVARRSG